MIIKFKLFEEREKNNKTIRVDGGERGWYIDFYFDNSKLIGVDNKWDIKIPDWIGFNPNILEIASWVKKYDPNIIVKKQVYYILDHDAEKYNL